MKKIFDKISKAVGHSISDAKLIKDFEKWTYSIEHKEMKDSKQYRVIIYELEEVE